MTGGPNNWAAQITYPPGQAPNTYVFYNYKDTVNVEWVSWAANSSVTNMRIWYWAPNFPDKGPWQPFDQQVVVSQNGTRTYMLNNSKVDALKKAGVSYFLGQWNLNFTREDNNPAKGLTLSQGFNCSIDDSKPAQVYGKAASDSSGSSDTPNSASSTAASSTPSVTFGGFVASPSATTSNGSPATAAAGSITGSASTSPTVSAVANGGLSGGAIAGVVIGVLAAVSLFAAGAFFLWRRNRMNSANAAAAGGAGQGFPGQGYNQPPPPGYSAYGGPGPAVYAGTAKQPMTAAPQGMPVPAEYYNKAQPPMPPMAQSQMYSELPTQRHLSMSASEMPASQPIRQELPG